MREQTNVADPEQIKEAGKREKLAADQWQSDLRYVLSDRRGRRFYMGLINFCGLFQTSFTGNSETFFKEGQRNVGLKLFADLNLVEPKAYATMIEEEGNERK